MVVTNPFLTDTLSDSEYTTFFHPWVIYSSLHFDAQFCFFYNWNILAVTTTSYCFCLFPKIFFPKYFFHPISISLSSQNFTSLFPMKNDREELQPPSPTSFGWCPLAWLPPPFLCPSYSSFLPCLVPVPSPISPSLPSCSCPLPFCLSL